MWAKADERRANGRRTPIASAGWRAACDAPQACHATRRLMHRAVDFQRDWAIKQKTRDQKQSERGELSSGIRAHELTNEHARTHARCAAAAGSAQREREYAGRRQTALHIAASRGRVEAMVELILAGADVGKVQNGRWGADSLH